MTHLPEPQTDTERTAILYDRAEEIFLLCCIINRRGLAHAFCHLSGHVSGLDSKIKPVDATYEIERSTAPINSMRLDMESFSFLGTAGIHGFDACLKAVEGYIDWLEAVIEKGEVLTTEGLAA